MQELLTPSTFPTMCRRRATARLFPLGPGCRSTDGLYTDITVEEEITAGCGVCSAQASRVEDSTVGTSLTVYTMSIDD